MWRHLLILINKCNVLNTKSYLYAKLKLLQKKYFLVNLEKIFLDPP